MKEIGVKVQQEVRQGYKKFVRQALRCGLRALSPWWITIPFLVSIPTGAQAK